MSASRRQTQHLTPKSFSKFANLRDTGNAGQIFGLLISSSRAISALLSKVAWILLFWHTLCVFVLRIAWAHLIISFYSHTPTDSPYLLYHLSTYSVYRPLKDLALSTTSSPFWGEPARTGTQDL